MLKYLLSLIFIVRVFMPTVTEVYHATKVEQFGRFWRLHLTSGEIVRVPIEYTIIEEDK